MKLTVVFLCAALSLGAAAARGSGFGPDSTPAYLVLGKRHGEIWRCLFDAPETCELFHKGNSTVTQTLLHDEHLYASHDDGTILKCDWYENDSCQVFYRADSHKFMNSMAVSGGYLYAGGDDQQLIRCLLTAPHACETVLSFDRRITSLYDFDKYIYVGTDQYLSRCPKGADIKCTQIASTSGQWIKGISGWNSTVIVVEWTNGVWTYDSTAFNSVRPNTYKCNHLAYFEGNIYLIREWDIIEKCKWDANKISSCSNFTNHKDIRSIAFVYGARHLRKQHLLEEVCQPQLEVGAVYEEAAEHRGLMEAQVVDGKLCDARGVPVDTRGGVGGRALFALGPDGRLLLSVERHRGLTHTATFFSGLPVAGAGEMVVQEGVVARIVACSRHYRVDVELNRQVVDALHSRGYNRDILLEPCDDDTNDYDYSTNQIGVKPESNNNNN